MADLQIQEIDGGVIFIAKIVPASSRTAISGLLDGMLKIKISAAPEKQKANRSLLSFLAKQLGVKKKSVSIISGRTGTVKQIQVLDISAETMLKKLNLNR